MAASEEFKLRGIYIRTAFIQAKELDREVYTEPCKDMEVEEATIWIE